MSWRDDYRPGAFRGVPFHLKTSTSTGGRRTVLNEYPLRDEPSTEDMGRRARQYQLTMTLIGPDYMARRDRLIEALEAAGPGTLVHPFRGELYVAVLGDYSCEESTEQGEARGHRHPKSRFFLHLRDRSERVPHHHHP